MTRIRKEEEGGGNHAHRAGDGDELKEKIKKIEITLCKQNCWCQNKIIRTSFSRNTKINNCLLKKGEHKIIWSK